MKTLNLLAATVLSLAIFGSAANAQEKLQLQFRGSCISTNDAGRFVKRVISERTLVKECATDLGVTNKNSLVLAYNVGGDLNGDVIEVVTRSTGESRCQKLRLLFPQTLSNGDGTVIAQLVHVFGEQQSEDVGSGIITRRILKNNKTVVSGTLSFYILPEGTNSLQLCRASFNTTKALPSAP